MSPLPTPTRYSPLDAADDDGFWAIRDGRKRGPGAEGDEVQRLGINVKKRTIDIKAVTAKSGPRCAIVLVSEGREEVERAAVESEQDEVEVKETCLARGSAFCRIK
jgi:hypothetical protein